MANRVSIRKEEDSYWEREVFAETSPDVEGHTFIGVNVIGHRLDVALNQEELAEFISELQKFINPTHNG